MAGQAVAAVHELQEERVRAAAWVAGQGQDGQGELRDRRRRVDGALAAYRAGAAGLGPTGDPALDQAVAVATERLDRLAVVRVEVDRRLVTPARVLAGHDAMVDALLGVTRGLAARLEAPAPARSARLLLALTAAKEATGQERVVLAAAPTTGAAPAGPGQDGSLRLRLAATAAVARQELNGVRAAAGSRLEAIDRALGVPGARSARRLELALLDPAGDPAAVGDLDLWRAGLTARAGALRRVEREVAGDLAGASGVWLARQEARLRDRLVLLAVVLVASLAAVLLLLAGARSAGVAPAGTRAMVPGLARRGQALAARQLQLLEELAAEEPDPHRRQGLLGVDHLANRLRRTAETLFAVAGTEPAGRWARPVPLNVLLRAAIAEADPGGPAGDRRPDGPAAGRRVDLLTTGEVEVEGPAGIDLVHLLAELLDNAAAFSPAGRPDRGHRRRRRRRLPDRGRRPRPRHDRPGAGLGQPAPGQRRRPRPGQPGRRRPARPGRRRPPGRPQRVRGPARPLPAGGVTAAVPRARRAASTRTRGDPAPRAAATAAAPAPV